MRPLHAFNHLVLILDDIFEVKDFTLLEFDFFFLFIDSWAKKFKVPFCCLLFRYFFILLKMLHKSSLWCSNLQLRRWEIRVFICVLLMGLADHSGRARYLKLHVIVILTFPISIALFLVLALRLRLKRFISKLRRCAVPISRCRTTRRVRTLGGPSRRTLPGRSYGTWLAWLSPIHFLLQLSVFFLEL